MDSEQPSVILKLLIFPWKSVQMFHGSKLENPNHQSWLRDNFLEFRKPLIFHCNSVQIAAQQPAKDFKPSIMDSQQRPEGYKTFNIVVQKC